MFFAAKSTSARTRSCITRSAIVTVIICILISTVSVGTVAWLTKRTSLSNMFSTGSVESQVQEVFDAEALVKRDVAVANKGNTTVYVRAAVSIFWEDDDGNVIDEQPAPSVDYTLVLNTSPDDWFYENGVYYFKKPLAAGATSDVLVEVCEQLQQYSDGRILVVDVACQSIQATPPRAVEEAWGVSVDANGHISK